MAWVKSIRIGVSEGRVQPTQVEAVIKVFEVAGTAPIVQIDTYGSADRGIPGKVSQTLQFGEDTARQLFDILKQAYRFQ